MNAAFESVTERQPKRAAKDSKTRWHRAENASAKDRRTSSALETVPATGEAGWGIVPGSTLATIPVRESAGAVPGRIRPIAVPAVEDHEREADRVAELVTRMPAPLDKPGARHPTSIAGAAKCAACATEGGGACTCAQRKADPAAVGALRPLAPTSAPQIRGAGRALPAQAREFFEPRFGRDLSRVTVHTDHRAGELARQFGAHCGPAHRVRRR